MTNLLIVSLLGVAAASSALGYSIGYTTARLNSPASPTERTADNG